MKTYSCILLTFIFLSNVNPLFSQCNDRYQTEIFSSFKKTTVQYSDVYEVRNGDGNFLKMDIYEPGGDNFALRPVVLLGHGGTYIGGDRNESTCVKLCETFALRGYVAVSFDYRLANSQADLIDSINALRIALRSVSDAKAAIRFLRKDADTDNLFRIDSEQIFIGGNSAGAITALHTAYVRDYDVLPSYIKPLVDEMGGLEGNSGNPGYPSDVKGVINLAGGINKLEWIQQDDVPMISCHGNQDETVPYNCDIVLKYLTLGGFIQLPLVKLCGSGAIKQHSDQIGTVNLLYTYNNDGHVPWESDNAKRGSMTGYVTDFVVSYTECKTATVGVIEKNEIIVDVFPNPTANLINMTLPSHEKINIELIDFFGKTILVLQNVESRQTLDIAHLPAGNYLLRFISEQGNAARRIQKI